MPGVLADQDGRPAVARVERGDLLAGLHEARLVEDAVSRQEHLAVDVSDAGTEDEGRRTKGVIFQIVAFVFRLSSFVSPERGADRAVIVTVAVALVEAGDDIQRRGGRAAGGQ